ncbi:MAG: hypothetical protein Q8R53_03115 [Nanoarchaeota archaeon]|nr:hypothetical protein [Nanoarchaeota archaeon]
MSEYQFASIENLILGTLQGLLKGAPKEKPDNEMVLVYREKKNVMIDGILEETEAKKFFQRINFMQWPYLHSFSLYVPEPVIRGIKRLLGAVPSTMQSLLLLPDQTVFPVASPERKRLLNYFATAPREIAIQRTYFFGVGRADSSNAQIIWDAQFYVHHIFPAAKGGLFLYQDNHAGRLSISNEEGGLSLANHEGQLSLTEGET